MTLRTALLQGVRLLEEGRVDAPRLTAEVLLSHAIRRERVYLFSHPEEELAELGWIHYGRYLHERLKGKPLQYITRSQEFFGREFRVGPDVLIPRPETELLVELALPRITAGSRVLDIGVGSGCIAVTLALESAGELFGTDLSAPALAIASSNREALGAKVRLVQCDLGSALGDASFDVIVSNPPYVPMSDRPGMQREVREWEPHLALFGGDDGLDLYRRLIPECRRLLKPGGRIFFEFGQGQTAALRELLQGWRDVTVHQDLAGIDRVVSAQISMGADRGTA